jgi:hypothetical protein
MNKINAVNKTKFVQSKSRKRKMWRGVLIEGGGGGGFLTEEGRGKAGEIFGGSKIDLARSLREFLGKIM